jgi:prephenate dehydrogenase
MAASYLLPKLAAVALLNATIDQPGWREGQKLAGKAYAQATQPALSSDETKEFGQSVMLNRENVLRALDNLIAALHSLRSAIEARDSEALAALIQHARQGREAWWKHRQARDWEVHPATEIPGSGEVFARMIGLRAGKKPK